MVNKDKVLLTKRAQHCSSSPDTWYVPAGKIKYTEIPEEGAIRECFEETGINIRIVKELSRRTAVIKKRKKDAYRLIFTYLVEASSPISENDITLNREHSEFVWVDKQSFENNTYQDSLVKPLQDIIRDVFMKQSS